MKKVKIRNSYIPASEKEKRYKIGIIYLILNMINGKIYIGKTINTFQARYGTKSNWVNCATSLLKKAIKKYGQDMFEVFILEANIPFDKIGEKERKYIEEFNSRNRQIGYNLTVGGESSSLFTVEDLIIRFIELHGEKYIYNLKRYIGPLEKIKIFCKKCNGYFFQTVGGHLTGRGCKRCADIQNGINHRVHLDDFLIKAKLKHGENFEYFTDTYQGVGKKLKIKHIVCGRIFEQIGSSHLKYGCQYCSLLEKRRSVYQVDLKTKTVLYKFNSLKDATLFLKDNGMKNGNIQSIVQGKRKSLGGYGWCYTEDLENYLKTI